MRIDVMGVGFDSLTMDEAVARARDLMAERRAAYVVTPNPEIVMLCRDDPAAMLMCSGCLDPPLIHHHKLIRSCHRIESMSNHNQRFALYQF